MSVRYEPNFIHKERDRTATIQEGKHVGGSWHNWFSTKRKEFIKANAWDKLRRGQKLEIKRRLNEARLNERIDNYKRRRELEHMLKTQPKPFHIGGLVKLLICLMLLGAILELNMTGNIIAESLPTMETDTTILYNQSYLNQFYEDYSTTTYLNRILNSANAIETFGRNTTWASLMNTSATGGQISGTLNFIGNILVFPINIIINFGNLAINVMNALMGKEGVKQWHLRWIGEITPQGVRFTEWIHNIFNGG